jgi:hypothetical protein
VRRHDKPDVVEVDVEALEAILERSKEGALGDEDRDMLRAIVATLRWLLAALEKTTTTLKQLRQTFSLNTKKTEKTRDVLAASSNGTGENGETPEKDGETPEKDGGTPEKDGGTPEKDGETPEKDGETPEKKKRKGHGRNGADAYKGAKRIAVAHESLQAGDPCPAGCENGKLYRQKPHPLIRLKGQAPIPATIFELEKLRCNMCGEIFTAKPPPEAGEKKHDETAASMIALLRYGYGLPFCRLEELEKNLGIPLPDSTQWYVVAPAAEKCVPVYEELIRTGAQGDLFLHDDTPMKVLSLLKENQQMEEGSKERTGMFTTGVVAFWEGHQIVLFFTGRQHAGENLQEVLRQRAAERAPPIQMCDGSSRNEPEGIDTISANCLSHGRRKFAEVVDSFPEECRHMLEELGKVYKNDAVTRKKKMSPEERLHFHQAHSAKIMEDLKSWIEDQLAQRKVEPNSSLGGAYSYMLKRWEKLTLFLRKAGAPLDNNTCEQVLKMAIRHRKNSLFYKTLNGARAGDVFMSLIHTAERAGANPFDYLTELLRNAEQVRTSPQQWMPWNYRETLAALDKATDDQANGLR